MDGLVRAAGLVRDGSLLVALVLLGGLGGCMGGGGRPPAPVQHPMLQNVPLPDGFRIVDQRSRGMTTGGQRWAQCEFMGNADRATVVSFFEEYMPTAGWALKEKRFTAGVYDLRFDSARERCDLRVYHQSLNRTKIDVDLRQIPGGAADGEAPTGADRPRESRPRRGQGE
ncbi:MAG: hypothetical protein AB7Q17_10535 [Phycisphaerae bacterium]